MTDRPSMFAAGLFAALLASPLGATEAPSLADQAVRTLSPTTHITSSTPSAIPSFRQIVADGQVLFVSNDGRFVVQGQVFDLARNTELTEVAMSAARADVLKDVSDNDMIVYSPAKPKYVVTVFTDPGCGYCRAMHEQIQTYLDAGIAIRYLPYPRSGLRGPDADATRAIWCSKDRKGALTAAFAGSAPHPTTDARCAEIVASAYDLGNRAGIHGTPSVFTADGHLIGGVLSAPKMLAALEAIAAAATR